MRDDEKFDEFVRRHAAGYRAKPEPDADDLWREIEGDVRAAIAPRPSRRSLRPASFMLFAALGVAATLVIGVFLGRWTATPPAARPSPIASGQGNDLARIAAHLRASTQDYLAETELFLTELRADLRVGRAANDRAERSRELLARTRLLLQSPEQRAPAVNRLLEDLELLLAEVAALPQSGRSVDSTMLEETLRDGGIIPRIRTTLPVRAGT